MPQHPTMTHVGAEPKPARPAKRLSNQRAPRLGPGEYVPDATEGLTRVEDLPQPEIVRLDRNQPRRACPQCGHLAYRDKVYTRRLHEVGDLDTGRPRELEITFSQHCCTPCHKYFQADLSDLAPPNSRYTHRVIRLAVRTVVEDGLPYAPASWRLWRDFRVFVPWGTIQNWVEAGEKKGDRSR